jgi:hypothetical protein
MNNELRNLINESKGKFFSITFIKKDGEIRTVNGKGRYDRKVKKTGNIGSQQLQDQGYVPFVNRNRDQWVCAHTDRVIRFQCGNLVKVFPTVEVSV